MLESAVADSRSSFSTESAKSGRALSRPVTSRRPVTCGHAPLQVPYTLGVGTAEVARVLDKAARESLDQSGYVFLPNVQLSGLASICESLGTVSVDKRSPQPYRCISPQQKGLARENTLSSRYGIGSFPFHTDAAHWRQPPRYLVLFCSEPGSGNRETHLIDTRTWEIDNELRLSMRSAIWKIGHKDQFLGTLATESEGKILVRYDTGCMSPVGPKAEQLKADIDFLIDRSAKMKIAWKKNSVLIISNSRLLHARGTATALDTDRILIRALIGGMQ